MIITTDIKNIVVCYQRNPTSKKHRGFICETETIKEAINSMVDMIASYCTTTRDHPKDIISKVENV
jgi:hypothetical protein